MSVTDGKQSSFIVHFTHKEVQIHVNSGVVLLPLSRWIYLGNYDKYRYQDLYNWTVTQPSIIGREGRRKGGRMKGGEKGERKEERRMTGGKKEG